MCKTRFDSQIIILNVFLKKSFLKKNVYDTRGPSPFHGEFHKKNPYFFGTFPLEFKDFFGQLNIDILPEALH